MIGTNTGKIIVGDSEIHESRLCGDKVWIKKWSVSGVNILTLISFFCIIVSVPVESIHLPSNDSISSLANIQRFYPTHIGEKPLSEMENDCTHSVCSFWGNNRCCFHCYRINSSLITKIINSRYEENNCGQHGGSILLTLEEVDFEDGLMKKNWWDIKRYVAHIFITKCNLLNIEDGAFKSKYFFATKSLTFSKSQIPYYRKNMFTGLKLTDFTIYESDKAKHPNQIEDSEGIKFEFGVLENFKDSITVLQVQRSITNPEAIRNLTGIELNALQIIDFRYNEKLTYIPDGAFKTRSLNQLFISDNSLKEINDYAFVNAVNIQIIYLNNNKLKTLNQVTFALFRKHNFISVSNNNWICSCNLKFLTIYKKNDLEMTTCNVSSPLKDILDGCATDLPEPTSSSSESTFYLK